MCVGIASKSTILLERQNENAWLKKNSISVTECALFPEVQNGLQHWILLKIPQNCKHNKLFKEQIL